MQADAAGGELRPPGFRSITLYGPPPVHAKAAIAVGARDIGSLETVRSTTQHSSSSKAFYRASLRSEVQQPNAGSVSALSQASLASTLIHQNVSAVPSVVATDSVEAQAATTSPRHLHGRLNEGTVHGAPKLVPGTGRSSIRFQQQPTSNVVSAGSKGRGPRYNPSVVSWVHVAEEDGGHSSQTTRTNNGNGGDRDGGDKASPPHPRVSYVATTNTRAAAAVEAKAQMVSEASLRNTWAMRFTDTAELRRAVSADADTYTGVEEALVAELNTLRRAPADYAAVVEREAKVGAPYVQEGDTQFSSEAAAEEAALQLRRRAEQEAAQEAAAAAAAQSASGTRGNATSSTSANGTASSTTTTSRAVAATGSASNVPPKQVSATPPPTVVTSPLTSERKKAKKPHSNTPPTIAAPPSKDASIGSNAGTDLKETSSRSKRPEWRRTPEQPSQQPSHQSELDTETPGAVTPRPAPPAVEGAQQELTLAELRHQFRCQQRYRAALEAAVQEMRVAQRQAEAAQLAVWAAEDEKTQKRVRRSTSNTIATVASPSYSGGGSGAGSFAKKTSSVSPVQRGSPAVDETVFLRRSEEAAQVHRAYELQVHRLEVELQRARDACQRCLAGANLISSAVRALRAAQPVAPLTRSRGLSLAARDTADVYYGDEARVAALGGLYALSRATLFGLADTIVDAGQSVQSAAAATVAASTTTSTLEELSRQNERLGPEGVDADTTSPSGVLPVLSGEALLLAQVAQRACTMYGYISNEVRGIHLQCVGSPRTLLLQLIVGCLTPVLDITHQPSLVASSTRPSSGSDETTAIQCYAGMRIEGKVYAAHPDMLSNSAINHDAPPPPPQATQSPREDVYASVFGAMSDSSAFLGSKSGSLVATAPYANAAASDAAQRLWPLLWSSASTVGCGWQQVRGWRHVPTYAEAYQQIAAGEEKSPTSTAAHMDHTTAVICSTLLLASGFEEYEVGRACSGMTPAATRRVIQELSVDPGDEELHLDDGNQCHSRDNGAAADVRRAAVEVHSSLKLTLLTPTTHPVMVPFTSPTSPPAISSSPCGRGNQASSGAVVCVAVRVPYEDRGETEQQQEEQQDAQHTAASVARALNLTAASSSPPPPPPPAPSSVRMAAQVTRQSDPTPPSPCVDSAEVLAQRSPSDPSVWLVLVNAAAAFARHGAVPLALHLFAKDVGDVTAGYEHVAFIRLQQGHECDAGAAAALTCAPPVLIAPEWRYLLHGLSCMPSTVASPVVATPTTTAAETPASNSRAAHSSSLVPSDAVKQSGWAVLHEPLLGRDGVLLHPLSANFRATEDGRSGSCSLPTRVCPTDGCDACGVENSSSQASTMEDRNRFSAANGAVIVANCSSSDATSSGDAIHVAIQLPENASTLWWGRRAAALRATCAALAAEDAAEEEGQVMVRDDDTMTSNTNATLHAAKSSTEERGAATPVMAAEGSATGLEATRPPTAEKTDAGTSTGTTSPCASTSPPSTATLANATKKAASDHVASKGRLGDKGATDGENGARGNSSVGGTPSCLIASPMSGAGSASFSGQPSIGTRHTLSFYRSPDVPESPALRDYAALLKASSTGQKTANASSAVALHNGSAPPSPPLLPPASAIGVPAHLQVSCISLTALRSLNERLRGEAVTWQAHLARIQPLLDRERERIAGEAAKRKGKELQRLQHDHDDVARETAELQRRSDMFQKAIDCTWEALRKRERAQVLRRARLARATAELASIVGSETTTELAAPRVTLRLFNRAAVAAGSGRNVAVITAATAATHAVVQGTPNVLVFTADTQEERDVGAVATPPMPSPSAAAAAAAAVPLVKGGESRRGAAAHVTDDAVVLQPQQPDSTRTSTTPSGAVPAVVYSASCAVPPSFSGQATLLIDDEVAVTWAL